MSAMQKYANADNSLVLNVQGGGDGSFTGQFTYNGTVYPVNGEWHVAKNQAGTYSFTVVSDGPPIQIRISATGIVTGGAYGNQPTQITIAGAAATILGGSPSSGSTLSLFAGILLPQ